MHGNLHKHQPRWLHLNLDMQQTDLLSTILLQVAPGTFTLPSGIEVGGMMGTQADFVPQSAMMGTSRYTFHCDQQLW